MISEGKTTQEQAVVFGLDSSSVRNHKLRLLKKLESEPIWSSEENQIILEELRDGNLMEISRKLGKTRQAIIKQRIFLGKPFLTKKGLRKKLLDLADLGLTHAKAGVLLGISEKETIKLAKKYEVIFFKHKRRAWMTSELRTLRKCRSFQQALDALPGRDHSSVKSAWSRYVLVPLRARPGPPPISNCK